MRRHVSAVPVVLVANKCEHYGSEAHQLYGPEDAASLGMGAALPISAETSLGLPELYTALGPILGLEEHVVLPPRERRQRRQLLQAGACKPVPSAPRFFSLCHSFLCFWGTRIALGPQTMSLSRPHISVHY